MTVGQIMTSLPSFIAPFGFSCRHQPGTISKRPRVCHQLAPHPRPVSSRQFQFGPLLTQMNLDGSDAETAEELESLLLAGLVGKNLGRGMSSENRERISLLADCLDRRESPNNIFFPERLDILDGTSWNLIYSTEPLPPVTFLPTPLAVFVIVGIEQRYDTAARIVDNVILVGVDTPWRRGVPQADAEIVVRNSFDLVTENTIRLTLESTEARVRGLGGEKMRSLLPPLSFSWLNGLVGEGNGRALRGSSRGGGVYGSRQSREVRTSFCGRTLRIARSPGGELRIFSRTVI